MRPLCIALALLLPLSAFGEEYFAGGHVKLRLNATGYPDGSVFALAVDDPSHDQGADLRLKFATANAHWQAKAAYQLIGASGDSLDLVTDFPGLFSQRAQILNDDRRLMDLTHTLEDSDDSALIQRLDRLVFELHDTNRVVRVGRQAISWGNGLIYTPMDFINPFDPASVDTEYKTGDDMAYGQYLLDNGDDWQAVWVVRRDEDKNLDTDVNSQALKYHGFAGELEYDLLLANHYDDVVVGVGGNIPLGGAIVRGDVTVTDARDTAVSGVVSLSWSWTGFDRNMSGVLEYYYNGFGQKNEEYSPEEPSDNPDLVDRYARGELFTLGRHYLAGSVLVEVTPLLHLTPNVFWNMEDRSLLAQLVAQYDLAQNWQMLLALNVPVGSSGSEYGGIESGVGDLEFSVGSSLFAQLAWYF